MGLNVQKDGAGISTVVKVKNNCYNLRKSYNDQTSWCEHHLSDNPLMPTCLTFYHFKTLATSYQAIL